MNKKIALIVTASLTVSIATALLVNANIAKAKAEENKTCYVDFFNNYLREDFTLSNGFTGKGNNLLYKRVTVTKDSLVDKPEDPSRKNYDFLGWYLDTDGNAEWNFATDKVTTDTRLYAKWGYSTEEEDPEPEFTPPSTVLEESAPTSYVLDSIMYFKVENDQVELSSAAYAKLDANRDNVLPFMEYSVKNSKTITATFDGTNITITCDGSVRTIEVKLGNYMLSESNYETKAKNYEAKALDEESYHVMLAGSSSIEFWTTSAEDLMPIVSYNHGIGGTTIEQWDEKLNQRLVFPYKPKMVVYYVGINNVINSKESASTIWTRLEAFFNHTHEALPDTKVQYIMMNLIPGFPSYFDVINTVNENVVRYQQSNPWLTLINPGTALLKENGQPNAAYFRTDGLHLSLYGYVVWGGIIKKSILAGLENN